MTPMMRTSIRQPTWAGASIRTRTSRGVAVFAEGRGYEAEVERKHHPFRQQPAEHEQTRIRIVIKLVAATFRGFYDRPANSSLGVKLEG